MTTTPRFIWNSRPGRSVLRLALIGTVSCLVTAPSATAQDRFGTIKGKLVWAGAEVPQLKEVDKFLDMLKTYDIDAVLLTTSTPASAIHRLTMPRIASTSSVTISRAAR